MQLKPISDKVFYKEMSKIKERSKTNGGGILPPKKSASAYIIFQKEVSKEHAKSCHLVLNMINPERGKIASLRGLTRVKAILSNRKIVVRH